MPLDAVRYRSRVLDAMKVLARRRGDLHSDPPFRQRRIPRKQWVFGCATSCLVTATAKSWARRVWWVAAFRQRRPPEASDRLGNLLPKDPSAEDVERQAERLQIVPDFRLSPDTVNRVPLDDLERRRLRAFGR